jgi:phosphoglucosamine mutase
MLKQHGGMLGGEASGHILCLDSGPTGDGIVSALLVLEALQRARQTLAEARVGLRRVPQILINVKVNGGAALVAHAHVQAALRQVEEQLRNRGRVVLRPSGTEPLVRVTVEGEDADEVKRLADFLVEAVKSAASQTA